MTRYLLHANGPNVSTGYGVQCAQLMTRLNALGHTVANSSTYGQQGSVGTWHGMRLYPTGYETNGNDVVHLHASHFFSENAGPDVTDLDHNGWIITIIDVWGMMTPRLADFNVAAWCPVDHYPAPPEVLAFFKRSDALPIAMSRFGERCLFEAGLDPVYIPLSVDTKRIKPTFDLETPNGKLTSRQIFGIPEGAYVVGMVAMNKGWARDRKGFNEAFRAFGQFCKRHPDAVLFMHSEKWGGAEGINLPELATHAGIPEANIIWSDQYAYRLGLPAEMMAAAYSSMDVLLAPSHGEGFGVPLIEAQACGTPVIVTDFSAQSELCGAGWKVTGQPEWDPAQHASYVVPFINDLLVALEESYTLDFDARKAMSEQAYEFGKQYDADLVFEQYWVPFLASLEGTHEPLPLERAVMTECAVIVPAMRAENMVRLTESFEQTAPDGATLYVIADEGSGIDADLSLPGSTSYAEKVNAGYEVTTEPWVLVVGDDVEFTPHWFEAAAALSDRFDVIGTNDSEAGRVRNPDVAAGRHADHWFVRRAYVEEYGASLEGPGVLLPSVYGHWYVDKELIELAKARRVFTPCLESRIIHHHPGYDGREDLRAKDPVYMKAVDCEAADRKTWMTRVPLVAMQRTGRGK